MTRKVLLAMAAAAAGAASAAPPSYTLSIPGAPVIRATTDASANAWLASNYVASVSASFGSAANAVMTSAPTTPGLPAYTLAASEAGFSVERIKPEVWLGDMLDTPPGVDWNATYAHYQTSDEEKSAFIFDNVGKRVYVQKGGALVFRWFYSATDYFDRTYIASGACSGRPYKMFWTEAPWNAPTIDLSGKYVQLFGPDALIKPEFGTREKESGGYRVVESNVVVRGVYFDPSQNTLSAYGQVSGQFLLAYYDTGSYTTLKHVQVIEVGEPDVIDMMGHIGEEIAPHGTGYGTKGLWPSPVANTGAASQEDEFGPYYYQHKGNYSYSPKNNAIFPLRDTADAPWRVDVYWMESDAYGVGWPFERCQYACTWNTNAMPVLVAGDRVKIPDAYTSSLIKFQEPNGHARAPEGGLFTAKADSFAFATSVGYSCLKLTASDNVWFLPIRTVSRTNPDFFTLAEEPWPVGGELTLRGGSVAGTTPNYSPDIDMSVPGVLNLAESGSNYNPELYYDWTTASNEYASVIYGVNTSRENKPLEVHWSTSVQQEGMPEKIAVPCLVQRYRIVYPNPDEAPQIVIASQKGGAGESYFETGNALFFDNENAHADLPSAVCFSADSAAISFYAKAERMSACSDANILSLASSNLTLSVRVSLGAGGITYKLVVRSPGSFQQVLAATPIAATSEWHCVTFALSSTNAVAYVDGASDISTAFGPIALDGSFTTNALGAVGTSLKAPVGLALDSLALGTFSVEREADRWRTRATPQASDVSHTMCFTFPDGDLALREGTETRQITEEVSGRTCDVTGVLCMTPGAPHLGNGVFEADTQPVVYRQPDATKPGYNPNEEHAFIGSGSGGYFAWALRCDLNKDDTSEPGVLVQYVKDGRRAMKYYAVVLTNEVYSTLGAPATAGLALPGPHPLDTFDNPWLPDTYWDGTGSVSPAFRDRKLQVWARCAGTLDIHMYYPNQDGFDFTDGAAHPLREPVPWLSELNGGKPVAWTWVIDWPAHVETMRIGETLTVAANGLPEVWNAKSMAVIYPDDAGKTALLWDPTVERRTGDGSYATPAALLKDFGFDPADGNVTLKGGKYTFKDLPPSVGDRFFVNAALATSNCVCLAGALISNAGGSILYPNVLNAGEKNAIKALVPDGHAKKAAWDKLVGTLPTVPVEPSTLSTSGNEAKVAYAPRDHYAVTAMGATNYVTVVENDSTVEKMRVDDGDAVSMHVFKVVDDYYAGRVVTREDPLNLLSQQLAILYTEAFAGKADDFEFEWKKAVPDESGRMSTDYENVYKDVFDAAQWGGLTRFTIGQQGDTLANLVNTYYVMRYRAKKDTPAYAVMGDRWSDWCGPALAEGWLQRCVNNVTPFNQRMRDLYTNPTETTISMISQAGAPWAGDVALNQDNLTSVGLIQLYQTLLNKAESISLSLGLNDTDANKQLLLAAERLCDLYVLLGNEAYADALDPTIAFGTDYGASAVTAILEAGQASTGLFCFDNQVATLLDEELALLRGRTGANNPAVTAAPFYNRLVWNFTRGITAGEVAYAVNYDINSKDNNAQLNEDDAAKMYPQGHGDAWGHYLSAMGVWYRLLRNPYFTWSTSQMQMNVADNVVDVDYFDEERFAETAGLLARTASDIMDRTARKAWRDNGGAVGAGYLDEDRGRNFGYGEWATRGGVGGVMNWMVANSLLPRAETPGTYYAATFGGDSLMLLPSAPVSSALGGWTFECRVVPEGLSEGTVFTFAAKVDAGQASHFAPEDTENLDSIASSVTVRTTGDGGVSVVTRFHDYYLETYETNSVVQWTDADGNVTNETEGTSLRYRLREATRTMLSQNIAGVPSDSVFALSSDADGALRLRIVGPSGSACADVGLGVVPLDTPTVLVGEDGFVGTIGELRFWQGVVASDALQSRRGYVNPRDASLLAYTRGFSDSDAVDELPDETPGGDAQWMLFEPVWRTLTESGLDVAFEDDGLVRINRATARDLAAIPEELDALQRKLDRLDAGLNPIGLSDNAVPFDIASDGLAEGSTTHFEQIAERAGTALKNAAKIMARAEDAAKRLRQLQDSQTIEDEFDADSEADYTAQLIAIYGRPYEDDIGPTGTYPQGYEGPDLYHYMYMDLEMFGVTGADNLKPVSVVTYDPGSGGVTYDSLKSFMEDSSSYASKQTYSYQLSANGLVIKPASFTGSRKATGQIQADYTDYILAYVDWKNAISSYSGKYDMLATRIAKIEEVLGAERGAWGAEQERFGFGVANAVAKMIMINLRSSFKMAGEMLDDSEDYLENVSKMSSVTIGLASGFVPGLALYAAGGLGLDATKGAFKGMGEVADGFINQIEAAQEQFESRASLESGRAGWTAAKKDAFDEAFDTIGELKDAAREVQAAWAAMIAAAENFDTTIAEGARIQAEREATRAKRVNRMTKLRYNDMFFRLMRNAELARYTQAFDLAQKYVYMAAQTYDYETTLLSAERNSGDAFRAEIVGARSLGMFDDDGEPIARASFGDGGLSSILARMKENYLVLKGRLGINNPDQNATWFSLRSELFRIEEGAKGDADWRRALSQAVVDDIRTVPEYQRYCQSIASSGSLAAKEPALVIRFTSTIDFAKNFFGKDLEAGDHAFDSSYYATKIAAAGVKFDGYPTNQLAATPVVYLVPAGADRMRIPGGGENGTVLDWNVVDQVIPVPYPIGSTQLDDADWLPLYGGAGGADDMAKIRRLPSFRALIADEDDDDKALKSTRLLGRSVWNTKWVMIIPAGQLLGGTSEDREKALATFINGMDTDRDGMVDVPGVSDIELGFKTYSNSGN